MLKSWDKKLIDRIKEKERTIEKLKNELDITRDDYYSLKIMYNEVSEQCEKLMNQKTDVVQEKCLYEFMLQRLIRMVLNSMNEIEWYDTEIYYMCKTLKVNNNTYEQLEHELMETIDEPLMNPLPDDSEEPDE